MGLIADEQSAMAHVLKTAGKARTLGGPRVGRKKTGPLKRILRGRLHADRRLKSANGRISGLKPVFTRIDVEDVSSLRFPGNGEVWAPATNDS